MKDDPRWDGTSETVKTCGVFIQRGNCLQHQQGKCVHGHDDTGARLAMSKKEVLRCHEVFNI